VSSSTEGGFGVGVYLGQVADFEERHGCLLNIYSATNCRSGIVAYG
jgi:hypothetical protein